MSWSEKSIPFWMHILCITIIAGIAWGGQQMLQQQRADIQLGIAQAEELEDISSKMVSMYQYKHERYHSGWKSWEMDSILNQEKKWSDSLHQATQVLIKKFGNNKITTADGLQVCRALDQYQQLSDPSIYTQPGLDTKTYCAALLHCDTFLKAMISPVNIQRNVAEAAIYRQDMLDQTKLPYTYGIVMVGLSDAVKVGQVFVAQLLCPRIFTNLDNVTCTINGNKIPFVEGMAHFTKTYNTAGVKRLYAKMLVRHPLTRMTQEYTKEFLMTVGE